MRGLLEQRERLAEVRSLEIEALRNKERETEDEMRELGERRKLLERELAEATNHILELRDTHYQLADN
jgi:septal ring factor EnvC (AmiA/AmiB activator)